MYKEDLQEFTSSLASDTKEVISKSGEIVQRVAQPPSPVEGAEDEWESESAVQTDESIRELTHKITNNLKSGLTSLFGEYSPKPGESSRFEEEAGLYLSDPPGGEFKQWSQTFHLEDCADDITRWLEADPFLRQIYSQLGELAESSREPFPLTSMFSSR